MPIQAHENCAKVFFFFLFPDPPNCYRCFSFRSLQRCVVRCFWKFIWMLFFSHTNIIVDWFHYRHAFTKRFTELISYWIARPKKFRWRVFVFGLDKTTCTTSELISEVNQALRAFQWANGSDFCPFPWFQDLLISTIILECLFESITIIRQCAHRTSN